jgi:hypothetical protein
VRQRRRQMEMMARLHAIALFCYDFIVGDDWED